MREESDEAEDGDDFKLDLVSLVRHPLGESVQTQKQNAEPQNGEQQNCCHDDHQHVGFAGRGDERRQMMRRCWMHCVSHTATLVASALTSFEVRPRNVAGKVECL